MKQRTQPEACIWPGCVKPEDQVKLCEAHGYIVWAAVDGSRLTKTMTPLPAAPTPRPKRTDGHIYYVQVGSHIKIGWASDLTRRMRSYPPNSVLLAVAPGTRTDETALHRKLAVWRSHGREWYVPAPVVLEHISRVVSAHGTPPALDFTAQPTTVRTPRPKQYVGGNHRGAGRTVQPAWVTAPP